MCPVLLDRGDTGPVVLEPAMSHWEYVIKVGYADDGPAVAQVIGVGEEELFTCVGEDLPDVLTQVCRAVFEVEDS